MGDRQARNLKLAALLGGAIIVLTAAVTVLVIKSGSHTMSWGERISRDERYVYVDGRTLTQDDLAYIAGLRQLSSLTLTNCNVAECRLRDLEFASSRLWSVDLSGTKGLWDLSFLSSLSAERLTLSDCPGVSDLSVLNWDTLEMLEVDGTDVSDLAPLANSHVSQLSFARTSVSDLTPLASLKDLWWVNGSYTQVQSIDALADLNSLWRVNFDGCAIGDVRTTFMSRNICELDLSHTQTSDLSGFAHCTGIQELRLGGNPDLTDLSWLDSRCHETLTVLNLGQTGCDLSTLGWIASCKNLEELTLDGIKLGNLDICKGLGGLELLSAIDCGLTDISGISGCTKLWTILLGYNDLTDIRNLPQPADGYMGMVLDLSHNKLSSLRDLPNVEYRGLLIQGNEVGVGDTVPSDIEAYDLVMDWYEGLERSHMADHYKYSEIYLLGCPQDQREAVEDAFGFWLINHVDENELLDLLESDKLAYTLWVDFGGYAEIARAKQAGE